MPGNGAEIGLAIFRNRTQCSVTRQITAFPSTIGIHEYDLAGSLVIIDVPERGTPRTNRGVSKAVPVTIGPRGVAGETIENARLQRQ